MTAVNLALTSCGVFFLTGLLTGVWKYRAMITNPDAVAPVYVDICHRAALMYAFACLVLAQFAGLSIWPAWVNLGAVALPVAFFGSAVLAYGVHGVLKDTDNQLRRPHRLGRTTIHSGVMSTYIYLLVAGEVGGFAVLFAGALPRLFA